MRLFGYKVQISKAPSEIDTMEYKVGWINRRLRSIDNELYNINKMLKDFLREFAEDSDNDGK